jgi:hypothetical protein
MNTYEGFDQKSSEGVWLRCWNEPTGITNVRHTHHTLSGRRWDQLTKRCKVGSVQQERSVCYQGAENQFIDFQEFTDWSAEEVGYQLKDEGTGNYWSLDKDILNSTRIYSKETCLFVPNKVNVFVAFRKPKDAELPIGCYYNTQRAKYVGQVKEKGKTINLGGYSTSLEAHRAWQEEKIRIGYELAEDYKFHGKLYDGLSELVSHIEDQYLNYEETT